VSAPQTPTDTVTDTAAVSEATSGDVLSPAPGMTGEAGGPPALPDADAGSDDAMVEPVDLEDEADEADEDGGADDLLVREGDVAGDYLERLLDIVDFDGDIDLDVEGDRAVVAVIGDGLQGLVGPNGATLDALQELTRLAVQQQTGLRSRLMLDVGGYRARRRTTLTGIAREAAADVAATGSPVRLDAMNPFERKVVHDAISAIDGVRSESEGEEPDRRVVVLPD
jgi:spoIIIJ-associated protein